MPISARELRGVGVQRGQTVVPRRERTTRASTREATTNRRNEDLARRLETCQSLLMKETSRRNELLNQNSELRQQVLDLQHQVHGMQVQAVCNQGLDESHYYGIYDNAGRWIAICDLTDEQKQNHYRFLLRTYREKVAASLETGQGATLEVVVSCVNDLELLLGLQPDQNDADGSLTMGVDCDTENILDLDTLVAELGEWRNTYLSSRESEVKEVNRRTQHYFRKEADHAMRECDELARRHHIAETRALPHSG